MLSAEAMREAFIKIKERMFHPTALYHPGETHPAFLITEAMRGYGGILRGFMRRQVALRQGLVDGFSDTDSVITVFRGIPYAKPSRWRITICLVS